MSRKNRGLSKQERRQREMNRKPKGQASTLEFPNLDFDKDFLLGVLSKNLLAQSDSDVCKAATILWGVLPDRSRYLVERAYGTIDGDTYDLEYAPWARSLSDLRKPPEDVFLLSLDGRLQNVQENPELMNKAVGQVIESYLVNRQAQECAQLQSWGWRLSVVGFLYCLKREIASLEVIFELFAILGKCHQRSYEYRLIKLLWIAAGLSIRGSIAGLSIHGDNSLLKNIEFAFRAQDLWGYDGDVITPPKDDWNYVYLMHSNTGHYKIGLSNDPARRASEMVKTPTILPIEVNVIHTFRCEDARLAERALHRLYNLDRQKGEWFNLTEKQVGQTTNIKHFDCTSGFVPTIAFWAV